MTEVEAVVAIKQQRCRHFCDHEGSMFKTCTPAEALVGSGLRCFSGKGGILQAFMMLLVLFLTFGTKIVKGVITMFLRRKPLAQQQQYLQGGGHYGTYRDYRCRRRLLLRL